MPTTENRSYYCLEVISSTLDRINLEGKIKNSQILIFAKEKM